MASNVNDTDLLSHGSFVELAVQQLLESIKIDEGTGSVYRRVKDNLNQVAKNAENHSNSGQCAVDSRLALGADD